MRQHFPHLKEWCKDHLWAPGCYHGSVGQGWEVIEKYIGTSHNNFYQIDSTSIRQFGGSGLGLAIVKDIIEGHGGTIRVESTSGEGSTFIFTLNK